jgi:L-alanine-DL-glutamate epimerase-like enolase superfamily enzyme
MFYGPVAHVASLHSMAALPNFLMQEWDAAMESRFAALTSGTFPLVAKGHVTLSDRPGLGLEMNWPEWDQAHRYQSQSLRPPGGK